jgi:AcrR family transcriptional regulator
MNHIVTTRNDDAPTTNGGAGSATYADRRAAMADETRTRILEACVAILARGPTELSIPAVAREAGVSVPTVYRNFPDKKTLVQQTAYHLKKLRGPVETPISLHDLPSVLRSHFAAASSVGETVRAALVSEPILNAKRELGENDRRRKQTEHMLGDSLDQLSPQDRERAVMMTLVLCSSATLRAFRELVGSSPDEAADVVTWAIGRIVGRAVPPPPPPRSTPSPEPSRPAKTTSNSPATPTRRPSRKGTRS